MVLTILSAFLGNQFYYKEFYYLKKKQKSYKLLKAKIVPFPDHSIEKIPNYTFFTITGLQKHFGQIYNNLLKNSLSNSLFYLTFTLMASLRKNIFETSPIEAWIVQYSYNTHG